MEPFREPNEDLERLSKAVMRAIATSKEIKQILRELQAKDMPPDKSLMVLMVNMKAVSDMSSDAASFNEEEPRQPQKTYHKKNVIDGREMTRNEQKFQEYCSRNFDEEQWLKKNRINLEKD